MKCKKRWFRFFSVFVICMILVSATCPVAFAAVAYTDQGFLVDPVTVDLSDFSLVSKSNGDVWFGNVYGVDNYEVFDSVSSVLVWFGDYSFTGRVVYSDTSSRGDELCYVGNLSLFSSTASNSGENFCLYFDVTNTSNFILYLSPDFYSTLESEYNGSFVFALQPVFEADFAGSVSAGLYNSIHWVGQVVSALISTDGALSGLLPLLAIFVAISALVFGIKVLRSIIWGA